MIENLDNLVLMLKSEDIEIRKLAGNYLNKNYKLDFNIYRGINHVTNKYTMELDRDKLKDGYYWSKPHAKALMNCIINFPEGYSNIAIYNFINLILKYNEKFR